jgi:hypothetical protein
MSSKLLVNSFLKKLLVILGCLLFLFSFIFPFYYANWSAALSDLSWSSYYWSYKGCEHFFFGALGQPLSRSDVGWFNQYWSGDESTFDIRSVLIPVFGLQLLTLVLGLFPIRFSRRTLVLAPILSSLAVAVLMTYAGERISADVLAWSGEYQLGYYLVFPSIAMFLFAFLLNEVTKKRKTTSRNISILVIKTAQQ